MKKLIHCSLFAFIAIVLCGCPYSAEVPIDTPSIKIDTKVLGKWESKSSSDYTYTISKQDAYTYHIQKKSSSSGDTTIYLGYLSNIRGTLFMNVYESGSSSNTYYFYKFEISTSGAKLTLSPVTENITEKFTNSGELKTFVEKNMGLSFFFDKDQDVYIKTD